MVWYPEPEEQRIPLLRNYLVWSLFFLMSED